MPTRPPIAMAVFDEPMYDKLLRWLRCGSVRVVWFEPPSEESTERFHILGCCPFAGARLIRNPTSFHKQWDDSYDDSRVRTTTVS